MVTKAGKQTCLCFCLIIERAWCDWLATKVGSTDLQVLIPLELFQNGSKNSQVGVCDPLGRASFRMLATAMHEVAGVQVLF